MASTPSWQSLLGAPGPCDHVVRLYKDEPFLARAVTHFVASGLGTGEGGGADRHAGARDDHAAWPAPA
jgi:hypothetical protein